MSHFLFKYTKYAKLDRGSIVDFESLPEKQTSRGSMEESFVWEKF